MTGITKVFGAVNVEFGIEWNPRTNAWGFCEKERCGAHDQPSMVKMHELTSGSGYTKEVAVKHSRVVQGQLWGDL